MKGKPITRRVTIAALVISAWTAEAEAAAGTDHTTDSIGTTKYVKVALFRRDGTAVAGYMTAVTDDSLVVETYDDVTAVRPQDVSQRRTVCPVSSRPGYPTWMSESAISASESVWVYTIDDSERSRIRRRLLYRNRSRRVSDSFSVPPACQTSTVNFFRQP